jgi:L-histidine N-alpha-methyltransferase
MTAANLTIDVLVDPGHFERALRADVREGLSGRPKQIPPKWFYDERGSRLFDAITHLPEYYLTRREREILEREAQSIANLTGADTLVEIGSGTSTKTRILLDAMRAGGKLKGFVPFDVSEETLRNATASIAGDYPDIHVHGVVGDFEHHLDELPVEGRRLVVFLGSTIGNLEPPARKAFMTSIAEGLAPGDSFLLGVDLVKDLGRLEAAYNDSLNVTAEFNKNVLAVINNQLAGHFVAERFHHIARYDRNNEWIEMLLESTVAHTVAIDNLDMEVEFARGELMRTETSAKFRRELVEEDLVSTGLRPIHWWTDANEDFALALALAD